MLLLTALAVLMAGCAQVAPAPSSPRDAASHSPPGEEPSSPAREPAPAASGWKPHRWVGEFRAEAQVAVCPDAGSRGCAAYAQRASTPVFILRLDADDPFVSGATRYAVTATWNASTQTAKVIHLRVVDDATNEVKARAKGVSPLSLDVPRDALGLSGSYRMEVDPDTGGLFYNQAVAIRMELA